MKVSTLFHPTQHSPETLKATPQWWSNKNKGSRFRNEVQTSIDFVDEESAVYESRKQTDSLASFAVIYETPLSSIPTYKDINPYTRSHCLTVANYMLQTLIDRTNEIKDFRHIGFTTFTYESLSNMKSPAASNSNVTLRNCKIDDKLISIHINCQNMIGSGAVSVVLETEINKKYCCSPLVAKLQTTEFHLSLRELYIALAYLERRMPDLGINKDNVSWLTPSFLVYGILTESSHHEGSVSLDISKMNMSEMLGVKGLDSKDFHSGNWCVRQKKRSSGPLCASILFSPTSVSKSWTLLDLSNAIHHSVQPLRQKMKGLAQEDVFLFIAYQLLSLISLFHSSGLIHADIKPDNFLVHLNEKSTPILQISGFDYGRSLDIKGYYNNASWFTSSCHAKGFQSCEMLFSLPWSYGIDYYGIACIMHVLISGRYLSTPFQPLGPNEDSVAGYSRQTKIVIEALLSAINSKKFVYKSFWKSFYTTLVTFDSYSVPGSPNQDKKSVNFCQHFCLQISRILSGHSFLDVSKLPDLKERINLMALALEQYEK